MTETTALIGTRKGLFTLTLNRRGPSLSAPAFLGTRVSNAMCDRRDGTLYASLDHGHFGAHLHRRDNGGEWIEIAAPAYPPKPEGFSHINPMSQKEMADSSGGRNSVCFWEVGSMVRVWSKEEQVANRDRFWSMLRNGVSVTAACEELVESLWNVPARSKWFGGGYDDPGIHSISIDPRGPGRLMVGLSCGGAWRSRDGGASWEVAARGMRANFVPPEFEHDPDTQDPHRLARCGSHPDVLWSQHHCGIFKTTDDGERWTEIDEAGPSTFGFAVVVHPTDPDTAWFVPAIDDEVRVPVDGKFVVTRTRDGGRSFDVLDNGLPAAASYDLVFRHGLDIDEGGDQLLMGSTTGSLWWSGDGGDSFELVSSNLPPINSVRFC